LVTDNLPFEKQEITHAVVLGPRVEPDGPVPCDLAVVGESPGKEEVKLGRGFVGKSGQLLFGHPEDVLRGEALIPNLFGRVRSSIYVTNVCKVPLPDNEWNKLTKYEQAYYYQEIRDELKQVAPKVVMAFGRRAAAALVPGFTSISRAQGKASWGYGEKYIVLPLWHPAYYLRGNKNALTDLVVGISQVPLLLEEGLPKPLKHGPALPWKTTDEALYAWPEVISFLRLETTKKLKCVICGSREECGRYEGEGLKWILCMKHAILTAQWAKTNEPALREHQRLDAVMDQSNKIERAADRMETRMRAKWHEREHYG
jgi:DNA polymerase